ncbi:Zn-dependent hydrolase [Lysinibacillus sp. NPDC093197]|uniref:Zn-dependent hydrolase n=1 Tax=Lysinibacillus sp. NPDC093197 TaxID=3364132 RepID=UPI0038263C39
MDIQTKLLQDYTNNQYPLNMRRIAERLHMLGQIGMTKNGGSNRVAHSLEDEKGRFLIKEWMEQIDLEFFTDEQGNQFGIWHGENPELPVFMMGSHTDTVPNGGHFDGALGVIIGLEVIHFLQQHHIQPRRSLVISNFSDEEGVLSGEGLTGSNYFLAAAEQGKHMIALPKDYFEVHIEQGKVLEHHNLAVGIVESIVALTNLQVTFKGKADHAGTTPMFLRKDPILAASEWILKVNHLTRSFDQHAVATAGRTLIVPNATNVIPEEVQVFIDIRLAQTERLKQLVVILQKTAQEIAKTHQIEIEMNNPVITNGAQMNANLCNQLHAICEDLNIPVMNLLSGAAHDALVLAQKIQATMLFIRSQDGISHHPDEWSNLDDIEYAFTIALHFVRKQIV